MKNTFKTFTAFLLLSLSVSSCKKEDTTSPIMQNSIVISSASGTKIGTCGSGRNEYDITINFSNPKTENIKEIEVDYIYPSGDAYFSYTYTTFNQGAGVIDWNLCRSFFGSPIIVRAFIVTTDGKRSAPYTFSLITQ
jgi:hypothetical protein